MRALRLSRKLVPGPIAAIEAEIASLETKKAALTERLPALESAKADALAKRRESLIGAAGSDAEAEAHRAAREAESNHEAVTDALTEVERRLAEAVERLSTLREQANRQAFADELERDCQAIDTAARQAREALAAFVQAKDALTKAITSLVAGQADMGWRAPREHVGTVLAGHMLANAIPDLKIATRMRSGAGSWANGSEIEPKPEHAANPIGAILTDRLRTLAAAFRAGTSSPDIAGLAEPEPDEQDFTPSQPQQLIHVTKSFAYRDEYERRAIVPIGHRCLPKPLVAIAIERGFASEQAPRDWHPAAQDPGAPGLTGGSAASQPDIGFSLKDWTEAERERARSAWHAQHKRTAA